MMQRFLPRTWNDVLALFLLVVIPAFWVGAGRGWIDLARLGDVNGALIAMWTLVVQYYFRRAPPGNGSPPPA